MKILLLNQSWFSQEFKEAGHEVVTAGLSTDLDVPVARPGVHIDSVIASLPNGFKPDRIVWLDNSAPLMFGGLEECDIPTVFYSVDTHHHFELHSYIAQIFDHILVAQKDYLPIFKASGTPTSWFPLWAPRFVEASSEKKFGAAFVGNRNPKLNPDRVKFFDDLSKIVPIHLDVGEYWNIFPFAEIVVNQTVKSDLNFRVFEAMMCGSTLLTEASGNGLTDLFRNNEHLVLYEKGNTADAAEKINSLLANKARAREIAHAGRAEILARHTPQNRADTLLQILATLSKRPPGRSRYFAAMINFSAVSAMLERADLGSSSHSLVNALRSAEQALLAHEIPENLESSHLVICANRYDRIVRSAAGQNLINAFSDAFPENSLLALAKIRGHLNFGDVSEATRLAKVFSEAPAETTFAAAEQAVSALLELMDIRSTL
jgi:hypothetical protein